MLNRRAFALPLLFPICALAACSMSSSELAPEGFADSAQVEKRAPGDGRLVIRSASMSLEVDDSKESADAATKIVGELGGMVDRSTSSKEGTVELVVRVPETELDEALTKFEGLGDVTRRSQTATDVTEEVVDLDARMKNLVSTRDSLRKLLERAASVQDVVAVEKELSRVQGEIDSMEARLKSLRSRVALSEVHLYFKRAQILGPLGYVGKGAWWAVSKLFVIRS